jgi:hypothetical protein
MNGSYGKGLAAFDMVSVWALWGGVALISAAVIVGIWLAMRCEK